MVEAGLAVANKDPGDGYVARVDSFVVETNVHHPTDVRLLWDATRSMLTKGGKLAARYQLRGWRQWQHHLKEGKKLYNRISRARQWRSRPHDIEQYLAWSKPLSKRMSGTVQQLQEAGASPKRVGKIQQCIEDAMTLQDQVRRRLLEHEIVPHDEKLFSVYEPIFVGSMRVTPKARSWVYRSRSWRSPVASLWLGISTGKVVIPRLRFHWLKMPKHDFRW